MRTFIMLLAGVLAACTAMAGDYVVITAKRICADKEWFPVAERLAERHDAEILLYEDNPSEITDRLRERKPRYVAVVETPERLGRDYIIELNRMARSMDDDIYEDYLWGVITGYDAANAMRMVENSKEPLVVRNAVATIMETNSARWFDRYAWVDDHRKGVWGEKKGAGMPVVGDSIDPRGVLEKFTSLYKEYDPDLVLTAAHATENNLEMPFSLGNWRAREGVLYADDHFTDRQWNVPQSGKRKVYFAVGNCLIGNMDNTRQSMAAAWLNSANATAMAGYVVTTWHGRNGWGALKYWLTYAGGITLPEAIFLNKNDMLRQLNDWSPGLATAPFPFRKDFREQYAAGVAGVEALTGKDASKDQVGFWHDRDVLAYYGDPKWEVGLQSVGRDYGVTVKRKHRCAEIKIKTSPEFDLEKLKGDKFKQEHVLDLPFAVFFDKRLPDGVRLAPGQNLDAVVTEDFILIYNPAFEPGKTYGIKLAWDK